MEIDINQTKPVKNAAFMYLRFDVENLECDDNNNDAEVNLCRECSGVVYDKLRELGYHPEHSRGIISHCNKVNSYLKLFTKLDKVRIELSKLYPLISADVNVDYSKLSNDTRILIDELIKIKTNEVITLNKLNRRFYENKKDAELLNIYL